MVAFKNKNEMVDAGGRTINEQQLSELNSELVLARSKTAEAKVEMDRVQAVLRSNSPDNVQFWGPLPIHSKTTSSPSCARNISSWPARSGLGAPLWRQSPRCHQRPQPDARDCRIRFETNCSASPRPTRAIWKLRSNNEESLQKQLDQAVSQSQVTNEAQVALRELESNAQTYRAFYDNFLQRYMESVQQQSFPITEARVISPATRPLSKSSPKTMMLLVAAGMVGLAFGVGDSGVAGFCRSGVSNSQSG